MGPASGPVRVWGTRETDPLPPSPGEKGRDSGARKLEEHGEELAQLVLDAARRGDWRAAAFLYERVYGRPKEDLRVELPASVGDVDRLTSSELEALRKRVLRDFPHLRVVGAPSVPPRDQRA